MNLITREQITRLNIDPLDVFRIVNDVFTQHGSGNYENPPKQAIHTAPLAFYHAMPAYLPNGVNSEAIAGTKLVGVYPSNKGRGLDALTGVIVLIDTNTGVVTDIVDAEWITNMRTAMVTAVTSKKLSRIQDNFFIIGSGAQARYHIIALSTIYPGCKFLLNSRNKSNCEKLVEEMQDYSTNIEIVDFEDGVKRCDNIVVCTSKLEKPILNSSHLKEKLTVFNVHSLGWTRDILDHVDEVYTDDKEQILDSHNGLSSKYDNLYRAKEFSSFDGNRTEDGVIFNFNYGLGIFDIALADFIRRKING